jgi:hypothetical protein
VLVSRQPVKPCVVEGSNLGSIFCLVWICLHIRIQICGYVWVGHLPAIWAVGLKRLRLVNICCHFWIYGLLESVHECVIRAARGEAGHSQLLLLYLVDIAVGRPS